MANPAPLATPPNLAAGRMRPQRRNPSRGPLRKLLSVWCIGVQSAAAKALKGSQNVVGRLGPAQRLRGSVTLIDKLLNGSDQLFDQFFAMLRVLQCVASRGLRLQRPGDDLLDPVVPDLAWRARSGLVIEAIEAMFGKALAPRADGLAGDTNNVRYCTVVHPFDAAPDAPDSRARFYQYILLAFVARRAVPNPPNHGVGRTESQRWATG